MYYARTRHNAGFLLADAVRERWQLPAFRRVGRTRVTEGTVAGHPVVLLKPLTYMNRSGAILAPLLADPGFEPARQLLVLVDDVALRLGTFRLRAHGSSGGHNGLKSVEGALRSNTYGRLRIGIGPAAEGTDDLADFVLEEFAADELSALEGLLPAMTDAVDCWLTDGIDEAMNRFNRTGKTE